MSMLNRLLNRKSIEQQKYEFNTAKDAREDAKKAQERSIANERLAPFISKARESMTNPILQNQLDAQQSMMGSDVYGDEGVGAYVRNMGDRAATIQDISKYEHERGSPKPREVGAKEGYTKWYMSLSPEERLIADRANRKEQFLNTDTSFTSPSSGRVIQRNQGRAEAEKVLGKKNMERILDFPDEVGRAQNYVAGIDRRIEDVNRLHGMTSPGVTGFNALLSSIPLTDSQQWKKLKETVSANIAIDELMRMKESSKTGASGLGQLNRDELKILLALKGNLDQAQSSKEIQRVLKRLSTEYGKVRSKYKNALAKDYDWYQNTSSKYLSPDEQYSPSPEQMGVFDDSVAPGIKSPEEMSDDEFLEFMKGGG